MLLLAPPIQSPGEALRRLGIDADRIAPKLWQGSRPPLGHALAKAGFDVVVLCAGEYQPASPELPGVRVIRAGIDDAVPSRAELDVVWEAGRRVARHLGRGDRVLVTCYQGWNRSGFVTATALYLLTGAPGRQCIEAVRAGRDGALSNREFCRVLERLR
jgi:protein-tyrosine phosphatase